MMSALQVPLPHVALHQVNLWAKAQSGVTSSRSASPNGALRFQSSAQSQPNTHYEMFSAFISCIFMRHYCNSGYFIDSRQTRPEKPEGSEHRPCKQDQKQLHAKIHHNISQCRCQNTSNGFKQFKQPQLVISNIIFEKCAKLLNGPDHLELLGTDDVNMRLLDDHQTTALQPAMIQDLLLRQVAESWQNPGNVQLFTKHCSRCGTRHATRNSTPEN